MWELVWTMMEEGFRERKNLGMRDEEREKDDGN